MSALDTETFPRGALWAVGLMLGLSLVGVGTARLSGFRADTLGPAAITDAPARIVPLRFLDQANGSVRVMDGQSDRLVTVLQPGSGAFVRGVMRGLAHDRQVRGLGAGTPFLLKQWRDGRLALEDPMTGREIDLQAFGVTNHDAFLPLLTPAVHPS